MFLWYWKKDSFKVKQKFLFFFIRVFFKFAIWKEFMLPNLQPAGIHMPRIPPKNRPYQKWIKVP